MNANQSFVVDWPRAYCEAFNYELDEYDLEFCGWWYVLNLRLPESDMIKLRDAIAWQAKEQNIV